GRQLEHGSATQARELRARQIPASNCGPVKVSRRVLQQSPVRRAAIRSSGKRVEHVQPAPGVQLVYDPAAIRFTFSALALDASQRRYAVEVAGRIHQQSPFGDAWLSAPEATPKIPQHLFLPVRAEFPQQAAAFWTAPVSGAVKVSLLVHNEPIGWICPAGIARIKVEQDRLVVGWIQFEGNSVRVGPAREGGPVQVSSSVLHQASTRARTVRKT